jgi:hypothetical protein
MSRKVPKAFRQTTFDLSEEMHKVFVLRFEVGTFFAATLGQPPSLYGKR